MKDKKFWHEKLTAPCMKSQTALQAATTNGLEARVYVNGYLLPKWCVKYDLVIEMTHRDFYSYTHRGNRKALASNFRKQFAKVENVTTRYPKSTRQRKNIEFLENCDVSLRLKQ